MESRIGHLNRPASTDSCTFHCKRAGEISSRFCRTYPITEGRKPLLTLAAATRKNRGTRRTFIQSDGVQHLGSALTTIGGGPFPGDGHGDLPLRILPIGGLGEIGMNCMLVGVFDRFILIDAGLMFPDFQEHGIQKILPDASFIAKWKDKIEAVVITHGHEDHIGAIPWVLPALDPSTPIYASGFVIELLKYKLQQFNLWNPGRFRCFQMRERHEVGPFELEPIRVTHSIPDCCGLILRSEHGTIVHTGDWKIDEDPVDGKGFDREALEQVGKEGVTLLMSDSTNVLSPGRTVSESAVRRSIADKVESWNGKGRVISTMFASHIHRIGTMKAAADAAGRKLCCVGYSLQAYLEAAHRTGDAPFNPEGLVRMQDLEDIDPNEVLVITTGSQGEDLAALNMASHQRHSHLKLSPDDYMLYSAKMIPGNEKTVMKMMNRIAKQGVEIVMGRGDLLHASGHGYRDELAEAIKLVKPQHFLPVHGESVFLGAHAELAQELGVKRTLVIHDGEMIGLQSLMSRNTISGGSMGSMKVIGDTQLTRFYNDGWKGTGTTSEMALGERCRLATEGVLVASVDVNRPGNLGSLDAKNRKEVPTGLRSRVTLTSRGMWTDGGDLTQKMCEVAQKAVGETPVNAGLKVIERNVQKRLQKAVRKYNKRNPEILVIAHERDPRAHFILRNLSKKRRKGSASRKDGGKSGRQEDEGEQNGSPDGGAAYSAAAKKAFFKRRRMGSKKSKSTPSMGDPKENVADKRESGDTGSSGAPSSNTEYEGDPKLIENIGSTEGFVALTPVPEDDWEEMQKSNPRENPEDGVDLDYG